MKKYACAACCVALLSVVSGQIRRALVDGNNFDDNDLSLFDETSPVLVSFTNSSYNKLSSILDTLPNFEETNGCLYQSLCGPSFHSLDADCNMWWPLNHTELHLHSHVPQHIGMMKVMQRLILSCNDNMKYKTVLVQNFKAGMCDFSRNAFACLDKSNGFEFALRNHHIKDSGAVRLDYLLECDNNDSDIEELLVVVIDERLPMHSQMARVTHIILHKYYATDIVKSQHSQGFHPWLSVLESRDDLGYALQSFLPHAINMVEVGVSVGNYASLLLHTAPQLQVYLGIDSYKQWDNEYIDLANTAQEEQEGNFLTALSKLSVFGDRAHILRLDSISASKRVLNKSVDFIYIDAMHHYRAVLADMTAWWPKLKPCGLFAGHDFLVDVFYDTVFTVKPAVLEFARQLDLMVLQTYDTQEYPSYPTWFIYKPCV
ncbi:class I SAM-dependent methyltransferase [archaeon]|nr:MAG: class I SAM-dependent methyltransferase [archaeon]